MVDEFVIPKPLRVLLVEDSAADAALVLLALRGSGLELAAERVDTLQDMQAALRDKTWDVVVADYRLPRFDGLAALRVLQERGVDVPFIIVSGNIGEETAVAAMRAGAHDYVLKDNLTRLGAAVRRELREAQNRREGRRSAEAERLLARRQAFLVEASRRLQASLNLDETLQAAAQAPLPEAADWCVVSLLEPGEARVHTAIGATDPALEARANAALRERPLRGAARDGAVALIEAGELHWTSRSTVLASALDPVAAADLLRTLPYHTGLRVPLVARGKVLGAMTLVRYPSSNSWSAQDVGFADEIAARAAMALDNAGLYQQAREAIVARDDFLSIASHELNTPLATLILQLDDFQRSHGNGDLERMARGAARMQRQVARLARLVENLLDVSRIVANRLQLTPSQVDLSAIAREAIELLGPEVTRSGCVIELDASEAIVGEWDSLRMTQVITNLLSNACKYGRGHPIRVCVTGDDRTARLSVADSGIGIAPTDFDRIFGRFERSASARHYGGLGIGLFITRQVVEAHGGKIHVDSHLGQGATFSVVLPRNHEQDHGTTRQFG